MKPYEKNYHLRYTPNFILFKVLNSWMETFESNFYVRVLFLGKDYDNFLKNEIEMIENEGQSFSDIIKKEEKLMKRLNNKHHYQCRNYFILFLFFVVVANSLMLMLINLQIMVFMFNFYI